MAGPPRAARRHDAMSHLDHLHTFIEAYRLIFAGRRTPGHDPAGSVPAHPGAGSLRRQAVVPAAGARRHPTDAAHELARAVGPMLDGLQARLASYKLGGDLSGTLHIAGPADFIAARLADGLAPLGARPADPRAHRQPRTHLRPARRRQRRPGRHRVPARRARAWLRQTAHRAVPAGARARAGGQPGQARPGRRTGIAAPHRLRRGPAPGATCLERDVPLPPPCRRP